MYTGARGLGRRAPGSPPGPPRPGPPEAAGVLLLIL